MNRSEVSQFIYGIQWGVSAILKGVMNLCIAYTLYWIIYLVGFFGVALFGW